MFWQEEAISCRISSSLKVIQIAVGVGVAADFLPASAMVRAAAGYLAAHSPSRKKVALTSYSCRVEIMGRMSASSQAQLMPSAAFFSSVCTE